VAFCMKSEAGAGGIISNANSVSICSSAMSDMDDAFVVGAAVLTFSFILRSAYDGDDGESGKGEEGEGATSLMPLLRGREEAETGNG